MSKDDDQGKKEQKIEQSRRDFLKGSAAAAGVGIAASLVPGSAAAAESDAKAAADGTTKLKNVIARVRTCGTTRARKWSRMKCV